MSLRDEVKEWLKEGKGNLKKPFMFKKISC